MAGRFGMALVQAFAALLAILSLASASWAEEAPSRVIAVGDLHGDHAAWKDIARAAGLMDAKGRWTGGDSVLVQMGDVTDRGPDSLKIIRSLQALEADAPKSGGRVVVLLGNHEAMNVIGDLRYVHPGEYAAFADRKSKRRRDLTWKANREMIEAGYGALDPPIGPEEAKERWFADTPLGKLEHRRAWSPGGELAQWAAGRPAVVQVGTTIFVHGGLSAERAVEPLDVLNARFAAALAPGEEVDRSVLEDPLGPLWYRGNITRAPEEVERPAIAEELAQVLTRYSASRLVVAHTPSLDGILADHGGRLLRVDTGIAAHYGGPATYLELIGERAIAHQRAPDGTWTSRELPLTGEVTP
ncbi:metallophosphoesterase [Altererythrobacter arenosus]|uniref:Metallophosphoesterase n=1 Tax=Altererythrobacter arenosus TaxID=3032592 RepID=A0ABY8FV92_9SPHN|nr:metallophosphoesterase [Altererythrobacter sp. CAU 1644]WFL78928.1 metallophosphoesterase [Altererythrobacter sp. CAU 1644]